jgi:hypothetical protein
VYASQQDQDEDGDPHHDDRTGSRGQLEPLCECFARRLEQLRTEWTRELLGLRTRVREGTARFSTVRSMA